MLIDKNHPQIQALFEHMNKIEGRIEELIATCASWEWMNQREVVQRLNMSPEYLAKLRRSGELTCSKIGNKHFFKRKDIEAFLESKRLNAFDQK